MLFYAPYVRGGGTLPISGGVAYVQPLLEWIYRPHPLHTGPKKGKKGKKKKKRDSTKQESGRVLDSVDRGLKPMRAPKYVLQTYPDAGLHPGFAPILK